MLAITKQHLAGKIPNNKGRSAIMSAMDDMRYLQLDPTSAVAPSHLLVLWSRLGSFRESDLESLQWEDKKLFEYWAHRASIVLTEDYPFYLARMKKFPISESLWGKRLRAWMEDNSELRERVLGEIRARGPLSSRGFDDKSNSRWAHARKQWGLRPSAWSSGGDTRRMLEFLFHMGTITVAGRNGRQKVWDLAERWLPDWTPRSELSDDEVEYQGAQLSLKALGIASPKQVAWHFLIGRYPNIKKTFSSLEADGKVIPVELTDGRHSHGPWYVHSDDVHLADSIAKGDWTPRTTLLSPFDNLIADRDRTHVLFDYFFRIEIYTPKEQRKHGFYVLSILDGDRLIGRIDPTMDRKSETLHINSVHTEPDLKNSREPVRRVSEAIANLGDFLGAKKVVYSSKVPDEWKSHLK